MSKAAVASGAETSAARAGAVVWTPPARVARAERGVPGTASPSVSAAEKQGRRIAAEADQTISIPKDKVGGLAVAAKAMLQQARKLAATARAVYSGGGGKRPLAASSATRRVTEGLVAYDWQIRQDDAQQTGASGPTSEQAAPAEQAEASRWRRRCCWSGAHCQRRA